MPASSKTVPQIHRPGARWMRFLGPRERRMLWVNLALYALIAMTLLEPLIARGLGF